MDRERDVLFLALSSHGKRDAKLVVTNGAFPLNWLTGEDLARMLRESGIRWKVVVISACYSGAFIEHLRDDHTIVITASSPDRISFGCNDRRDLTYFGEAFYRDALSTAARPAGGIRPRPWRKIETASAAKDLHRRNRWPTSEPPWWQGLRTLEMLRVSQGTQR